MKMLPFKIRVLVMSTCIVFCLILLGCSQEATLSEEFHTYKGSHLDFQTDMSVANPHSGLYFTLSEVPATKGDRDFSDFLSVELLNERGQLFRPEKIWDINGQRRDIVASFNNIPQGTQIKHVRILALQELQGDKIRWWSGTLK
jgi:hypothetical protein